MFGDVHNMQKAYQNEEMNSTMHFSLFYISQYTVIKFLKFNLMLKIFNQDNVMRK